MKGGFQYLTAQCRSKFITITRNMSFTYGMVVTSVEEGEISELTQPQPPRNDSERSKIPVKPGKVTNICKIYAAI